MVIDLIVTKTNDGFNAEVPSINGCDCWSATEDEVIEKSLDLVTFYLSLKDAKDITVDKARREGDNTIYKLIFDK